MPRASPNKLCGSPGCTQADHHDGLCSTEAVLGGGRRAAPARRTLMPQPARTSDPVCRPCGCSNDDDDDFEPAPCQTQGSRAAAKSAVKVPARKKRRTKVADSSDDDDNEYVPSGDNSDGEEEIDDDDDDDDDDKSSAGGRRPPPARSRKRPAAAAKAAAPRETISKPAPTSGGASSSSGPPRKTATATRGDEPSADDDVACTAPADEEAELMAQLFDSSNHTGNYSAEYAKTGRSKCRVCGEVIAHRELRVGIEADEKGWGIITRWHHVDCTRLPSSISAADLEGYDKLTAADQVRQGRGRAMRPPAHPMARAPHTGVPNSAQP